MLILNYHRIGFPPANARYRGMFVTPSMLAWHIRLLKLRGKRFLTVSEGVSQGCPSDGVAITFDDGYEDNLTLGLPVLKDRNVPATVYVVTSDVGKKSVTWNEAGDKLAGDLLSWDQLRTLQGAGWEIGSHASEHVHLARRPKAEQKAIVAKSWEDFRENLGGPPHSFAYPYGSQNCETLEVLKELRCGSAVTIDSSGVNTGLTPNLLLYRNPARGHLPRHYLQSLKLLWQS